MPYIFTAAWNRFIYRGCLVVYGCLKHLFTYLQLRKIGLFMEAPQLKKKDFLVYFVKNIKWSILLKSMVLSRKGQSNSPLHKTPESRDSAKSYTPESRT